MGETGGFDVDRAVAEACRLLRPRPPTGPYVGRAGMVGVALRAVPILPPAMSYGPIVRAGLLGCGERAAARAALRAAPPPSVPSAGPAVAAVVARSQRRGAWAGTQDEAELERQVAAWVRLLGRIGPACGFGRRFAGAPLAEFAAYVRAALAGKAAGTLAKRIGAITAYEAHAVATGFEAWPLKVDGAVSYLVSLAGPGAAPTRGRAFREAVAFCHGHFSLDDGDAVLGDRVGRGLATMAFERKAARVAAPVLPVGAVIRLEGFVIESVASQDVIILGTLLFCLYSRCRFGDCVRAEVEPVLDVVGAEGFIEASLRRHKTAGPAPDRLLPVVAPVLGCFVLPWAPAWLAARRALGVTACRATGLLPGVGLGGSWLGRRMRSGEATVVLRSFLVAVSGMPDHEAAAFTAHSLKATALSWCAKFGVPMGIRRTLGYHVKPKDRMAILYSRDAVSAPLRELCKVLASVRCGAFRPDATRSGHIVAAPIALAGPSVPAAASAEPDVRAPPVAEAVGAGGDDDVLGDVDEQTASPVLLAACPPDSGESVGSGSSASSSSCESVEAGPDTGHAAAELIINMATKVGHYITDDGELACGLALPRRFSIVAALPPGARLCCRCVRGPVA